MRVAIATVQVPFCRGGAEVLAEGLLAACRDMGYETDLITLPFRFLPHTAVLDAMEQWENIDFTDFDVGHVDHVICLKFPTYYLKHPAKSLWLVHQHRTVYELWGGEYDGGLHTCREGKKLKQEIHNRDARAIREIDRRFTIGQPVSDRLKRYNKIEAPVLWPPLNDSGRFYSEDPDAYVLAVSRLQPPKRQELLIEAMHYVETPVVALIVGGGGSHGALQQKIRELKLGDRVRLLGFLPRDVLAAFYARCLAVYFAPYDEDYGYVTLEAMLSAKPVITCADSGGPLQFVTNNETGLVCEPDPKTVAAAIDQLYRDKHRAIEMGRAGQQRYKDLDISWQKVHEKLLGNG